MSAEFEQRMPIRRFGEFMGRISEEKWGVAERHPLVPVELQFDEICEIATSKGCHLSFAPAKIGHCVAITRQEYDRGSSVLVFGYPEEDGSESAWVMDGQKQVFMEACLGIESEYLDRAVSEEVSGRQTSFQQQTSMQVHSESGFLKKIKKLLPKRFHQK